MGIDLKEKPPRPEGSKTAAALGPSSDRLAMCLAMSLAMIAGFLDAYGMITWATYVSFMSGNTTQTGYELGLAHWVAAVPSGVAIAAFLVGSFVSTLLTHSGFRHSRRVILALIVVILIAILGLTRAGIHAANVFIAAIGFAMGLLNAAMSRIGALSVNLTYVTGTLNRLGMHLALGVKRIPLSDSEGAWDTHWRRARILAGIWLSFFVGAIVSGLATPRLGAAVLLGPIVILLALLIADARSLFPRSAV